MFKETKRAVRRHHRERLIREAVNRLTRVDNYCSPYLYGERYGENYLHHVAARQFNNPKMCSCIQCGNQRRYSGPTHQERKQELSALSDLP